MAKLTLSDLANLTNQTTAVTAINANSALIETALENTLSRDGTGPNTMSAVLDMNSHKIINLTTPTVATDAATKGYVDNIATGGATGTPGADGADGESPSIYVQASPPATTGLAGSLWIDSDSTNLDLFQLVASAWVDTGVDLKGASGSGSGDVAAASSFGTDNRIIRSDGTQKGVQVSGVTIDDSANVSGIATLTTTGSIELGNASDTTVARSSAGNVSIEGNVIYRAGGTDVPVTDGGTGASTASAARDNLGLGTANSPQFTAIEVGAASDTTLARVSAGRLSVEGVNILVSTDTASTSAAGIIEQATDAETLAGTDTARAITPSNLTACSIYGNIPQNAKDVDYTLVAADQSKHLYHTSGSGHTYTIPANASVAFPLGTAVTFVNSGAGVVSIAITSDTMRHAGTANTGTRQLAQYGVATAIKVASTLWFISGSGLS